MEPVPKMKYAARMGACKPCHHPNRDQIDQAIISGVDYRTLSATYGISLGSISRHKRHVRDFLASAMQARQEKNEERGSPLLVRVEELVAETKEILAMAKTDKNLTAATGAVNAAARLLELCGRLDGSLVSAAAPGIHFHQTKNITNVINIHDSDLEIALLFSEATHGYNEREIQRLKQLAASAPTQPQP